MTAARRLLPGLAPIAVVLALAALVGCTAAADSGPSTSTVGTVGGVGELPSPLSVAESAPPDSAPVESSVVASTASTTTTTTILPELTVGARSAGNRLLMIGDSLTASISRRYGGEACEALVPLGWRVEVDAETGRFIDFGKLVLDQRLDAGWDAAVIFLGNNYGDNMADFQGRLHALLLRLVPRPTVLITTTIFRPEQADVNEAILAEAAQFTSVSVIDWTTVSADPSLTGADNLHLTEAGRRTLAYYLAAAIGTAPAQPGACLKTRYTNDSAGSPNGPPGNATKPKPKSTTTTVKPTATTVKPTASSTATTTPTQNTSTPTTSTQTTSTPATSTQTTSTQTTVTQTTARPTPTTVPPVVTVPPATTPPPPTTQPPTT